MMRPVALCLIAAAGCSLHHRDAARAYSPAGEQSPGIEGTYTTEVTESANKCRGNATSWRSDAEGYYVPGVRGRPVFRLVIEAVTYNVDVRPGGKFEGKPLHKAGTGATRSLTGQFKDGAFTARVNVHGAVAYACYYTLNIRAIRR